MRYPKRSPCRARSLIVLNSVGIGGAEDADVTGMRGRTRSAISRKRARRGGATGPGSAPGRCICRTWRRSAWDSPAKPQRAACRRTSPLPALSPGAWGYGVETSKGKDTPSGHWEIAGVPVVFDWGYFPDTSPAFPRELTEALIREAGLPGILGDKHASGTAIIDEFGAEHIRTGKPILYTSVDSVLQIAAHEETFGLERLYDLCVIAARALDPSGSAGSSPALSSARRRRDSRARATARTSPPAADPTRSSTVVAQAGRTVVTIGKIGDIFAHRGTGAREVKPYGNDACLDATLDGDGRCADGGFVFANFVDFDTRVRPPPRRPRLCGGARGIRLAAFRKSARALRPGDLVDHYRRPRQRPDAGAAPTTPASTLLSSASGPSCSRARIGRRESFADIGATVAAPSRRASAGSGAILASVVDKPRASRRADNGGQHCRRAGRSPWTSDP